ncbi:MAG: hypothetical protein NTZ97_05095 [Candidatus Moranbacteria bacterium]|nr:hypothetical protein [Candidatus Moranbacteria bacterium]
MKKVLVAIIAVVVIFAIVSTAQATPKLLPPGAKISRVIEGETATVTIVGVTLVDVEFYSYEKKVPLGPVSTFKINLREGRRFNFKFVGEDGKTYFALITPDMVAGEVDFMGEGIVPDFSTDKGCFKITK